MNEERGGTLEMIKKGIKIAMKIKMFPLYFKITLIAIFAVLVFGLLYAALYIDIFNESVMCITDNCDNSEDSKYGEVYMDFVAPAVINHKNEIQKKFKAKGVAAKKEQMGTIMLVEKELPHQRKTNQPITDEEFITLAEKMKKERSALLDLDLDEPAEDYGTVMLGGGTDGTGGDYSGDFSGIDSNDYWALANEAAKAIGWTPLFVYSQWQLETGHFKSNNFKKNNNIAGQTWTPSMGEAKKGSARPKNEGGYYIKYENAAEGYVDFIKTNPRYSKVKNETTPEGQAKAVAAAGWAADPNYYRTLVKMIETNRKKYGNVTTPISGTKETGSDKEDKKEDDSKSDDSKKDDSKDESKDDGSTPDDKATEEEKPTEGNADGDKVLQVANEMYEKYGIKGPERMHYSMTKRGQPGYGDCSWFTSQVYKKALGIDIGFTTIEQIAKNADYFNTDRSQLRAGDLVYFNTPGGHAHSRNIKGQNITVDHTGIYLGDDKFMDMSSSIDGISIKDISNGKFKSYFDKSFIGFIRLGSPGTGSISVSGDGLEVDEAELHLRALANTDSVATKGLDIFQRDKKDRIIKKKGEKQLKEEFKGTMIEKTYLIAQELKEDKENRLFNYVTEKRNKDWDDRDWMLNARFIAYDCYLVGDEMLTQATVGKDGIWKTSLEWIASLFTKGPCEQLDDFLQEATGDKKAVYIDKADRGVLTQYYQKIEYTYTCKPKPKNTKNDKAKQTKGVIGTLRLVKLMKEKNMVVGKDDHNCKYGAIEHKDITNYPVFPSKYSGAKEKSVLKNFEKYSLILPGKNTTTEDTYPTELERILRQFYGDALDQNEDLLQTVGGGLLPYIPPMESGTYNYASAFRSDKRPSHDGIDMGTSGVTGVPIYSTANGIVESTGFVGGYGYTVMVKHNDGYYSFYAHMKEDYIVVKKGQSVVQGQLVGGVDGMGNASGGKSLPEHLHFEMCERSVTAASGNQMCADHIDPEEDDDSKDNRPDDVKIVFEKEQDKSKSNERANKFLQEWKEKAKKGTVYMMPGFSAVRGVLSEQHESPTGECVNNKADAGGMSCGFYQFANNRGKVCEFVRYLGKQNYDDYYNYYSSYCPSNVSRVSDVSGFMKKWNSSPDRQAAEFKNAQYLFIKGQHYDVVANNVYKNFGLDVNQRHVAVQEMFWSIGVQQPGHIGTMFKMAGYSKSTDWNSVTDREIIEKVYQARYDGIPRFFSSSPGTWKGLRNRFTEEKQQALAMLGSQ